MGNYVYSDLDYSLTIGADGNPTLKTNEDAISQSIKTILSTLPGERLMYPTFGSGIPLLVFEPMDEYTTADMQSEITTALNTWEDRIQLNSVIVTPNYDANQYVISIQYTVLATGKTATFSGRINTQTS
jgi:uncharacterized protein